MHVYPQSFVVSPIWVIHHVACYLQSSRLAFPGSTCCMVSKPNGGAGGSNLISSLATIIYICIYIYVCVEVPCTKNQNWLMFYEQILDLSWNNYETLSKDICFQPARMWVVWTNMDANQGWPLTWEMRNERTAYPRGFKDFGQVNGWKTGTALISHKFNEWWMFIPAHVTYCQKVWETFVIVSVLIGPFVCNGWGYIDLPSYQIIQFIIEMCYYSTFW